MFNTLKNLKEKYDNSSSWKDLFLSLTGLKEQLANAKNDAERVKILNQIVEAQRKQLELLGDENEELKKQLKDIKELKQSKNISSELDKLEESEKKLEAKITQFEIITKIKNRIYD